MPRPGSDEAATASAAVSPAIRLVGESAVALSGSPANPLEPAAPTDLPCPAGPFDPGGPPAPAGPLEPVSPAELLEPVTPLAPAEPLDPAWPTGPLELDWPAAPLDPAGPGEPVEPLDAGPPLELAAPAAPAAPLDAGRPAEPAGPPEPAAPAEPLAATGPFDPAAPPESPVPAGPSDPAAGPLDPAGPLAAARSAPAGPPGLGWPAEPPAPAEPVELVDPAWLVGPVDPAPGVAGVEPAGVVEPLASGVFLAASLAGCSWLSVATPDVRSDSPSGVWPVLPDLSAGVTRIPYVSSVSSRATAVVPGRCRSGRPDSCPLTPGRSVRLPPQSLPVVRSRRRSRRARPRCGRWLPGWCPRPGSST